MYSRSTASAVALGIAVTAAGLGRVAEAQSNGVAATPRVVTTTQSRAASCNRACLESFVDRYFAAVIADDPSAVPLARDVRFTENGQVLPVGEGLWKSMKSAGSYRLPVTDPEAGQIALITTVVEDHADPAQGTAALLALRLKIVEGRILEIEDGQLAEIEAFLTRPPYGMLSNWSTWEDGMSDKIQDVTGYRER